MSLARFAAPPATRWRALALACACLGAQAQTTIAPAPASAASAASAPAPKRGDFITLNFNAADIEAVARTLGLVAGMNVVVDPRVKGTITLVSEKPVSPQVAMGQFLSSLRMQGFTLVEAAGLFKLVPEVTMLQ